jgi:hypothetical protein
MRPATPWHSLGGHAFSKYSYFKGELRSGTFDISEWDIWPATDSNCTSDGSYSATRCKPRRYDTPPEWWRK